MNYDVNKLIADNEKLVGYCFKKYINLYNHPDCEDIIQEGYIELIRVAHKFDPSKGNNFSTYAVPCIGGAMRRYLRDKTNVIKIPRSVYDKNDPEELNLIRNVMSLDYTLEDKDGGDGSKLADLIPGKPDNYEYEVEELIELFLKTIDNPTRRSVMEEYYYTYVFGGEKLKHQYFQDKYQLSQSNVSRIIKRYNKLFKEFINKGGFLNERK